MVVQEVNIHFRDARPADPACRPGRNLNGRSRYTIAISGDPLVARNLGGRQAVIIRQRQHRVDGSTGRVRKADSTLRIAGSLSEKVHTRGLGLGRRDRINRRWKIARRARRIYDDRIWRRPSRRHCRRIGRSTTTRRSRTG